jgi:hypothetical protein
MTSSLLVDRVFEPHELWRVAGGVRLLLYLADSSNDRRAAFGSVDAGRMLSL